MNAILIELQKHLLAPLMTSNVPKIMEEQDMHDDRPIAVRRKRRASTGLSSPSVARTSTVKSREDASAVPKTPTKPKKRVRFSDPGPEVVSDVATTGITPFIKRTTLDPTLHSAAPCTPRTMAKAPRRRQSLPSLLVVPSSTELPTPPSSGEIQFAPLRQLLDDRVKRRLRRNNLSEEINDIDAEKRAATRKREEIMELKEELALARQLGSEIMENIENETGNRDRITELEVEISTLKQERRTQTSTVESQPQTHCGSRNSAGSAFDSIYEDADGDDELQVIDVPSPSLPDWGDFNQRSTQTSLAASDVTSLQEHIRAQTEHLLQARLELEYICPGETTLGLNTDQGNVKPILDALVDRLRAIKAQLHATAGALSTTRTQESNLRNQFNTVLLQLDSARNKSKDLATQIAAITARSEDRARELETDIDDKQRSINKLHQALEKYRTEVRDLEDLVTNLEVEHKAALANLRTEMDEAVADLECHVAAETRGRREAEAESEQRLFRIRELEARERELKEAVAEKQCIVRTLEGEIESVKQEREREVGGLNVRVGELSSNLSEVKADLVKVEAERLRLVIRVEEEKSAAALAAEKMMDEMRQCIDHVAEIREGHEKEAQGRGQEVAAHKGLLTPVSAVRFRDVDDCEGYVETRRGKSRSKRGVDSGIGILEEDADEDIDMVM